MKEAFLEVNVFKNDEKKRFELTVDGHIAFIDFTQRGTDLIKLIHTEVPEALSGRGIAAKLVEKTLIFLEENKFNTYPICPYVFAYKKNIPNGNIS